MSNIKGLNRCFDGETSNNQALVVVPGAFHCGAMLSESGERVQRLISGNTDVYTLDLPGHGDDLGRDISTYSLMDYSHYVEGVLGTSQELSSKKIILGGHSLGGSVVQQTSEISESVKGLILLAPSPLLNDLGWFPKLLLPRLIKWKMQDPIGFRKLTQRDFFSDDNCSHEEKEKFIKILGTESMQAISDVFSREEYPKLKVPTLIVSGKDDRIPLQAHKNLAQRGDNVSHEIVSGGHDVWNKLDALSLYIHKFINENKF